MGNRSIPKRLGKRVQEDASPTRKQPPVKSRATTRVLSAGAFLVFVVLCGAVASVGATIIPGGPATAFAATRTVAAATRTALISTPGAIATMVAATQTAQAGAGTSIAATQTAQAFEGTAAAATQTAQGLAGTAAAAATQTAQVFEAP